MENNQNNPFFYVTTPIYYVNDKPHIGHAYSTVIADSIARFKRLSGYNVFFMTGTDEHGLKIEKEALSRGISPKELADSVHIKFKNLFEKLDISLDRFIRTTDSDHIETVSNAFKYMLDKGDIYLSEYEGWYCIPDETFLTEKSLLDGNCPQCGRAASLVKEESYFLNLSKYQDRLLKYIEDHPNFIRPSFRRNEVISFIKEGLNDLSISRTSFKWGIPVPGNEKHVIYVWFDALLNYLTGLDFKEYMKGREHLDGEEFAIESENTIKFIDFFSTVNHIVGKDIVKFHAVYWPIMLFALDLPLPETIFAHGWWLMDNKKMSKSLGNVVDPLNLIENYGADALRFYLLKEVPPGLDGDFNADNFVTRYNSELANDLGNLISRSSAMLLKFTAGVVPGPDAGVEEVLLKPAASLAEGLNKRYNDYEFSKILEDVFKFINSINKYINDSAPWKLNAENAEEAKRLRMILRTAFLSIYYASYFIYPFMPQTAEKINKVLNISGFSGVVMKAEKLIDPCACGNEIFKEGHKINLSKELLFPKK